MLAVDAKLRLAMLATMPSPTQQPLPARQRYWPATLWLFDVLASQKIGSEPQASCPLDQQVSEADHNAYTCPFSYLLPSDVFFARGISA